MGLFSKKQLSPQEINLDKIDNWLKNNANKILDYSLQSPANKAMIKNLESITAKNLPQDFKRLYLWHNGMTDDKNYSSLFYGMDFLPIVKEQRNELFLLIMRNWLEYW